MDLIEVDDVVEKLDELMRAGAPRTPTVSLADDDARGRSRDG